MSDPNETPDPAAPEAPPSDVLPELSAEDQSRIVDAFLETEVDWQARQIPIDTMHGFLEVGEGFSSFLPSNVQRMMGDGAGGFWDRLRGAKRLIFGIDNTVAIVEVVAPPEDP